MSGTASVSTQFSAATSATGAQLDGNFSTIVAYINDPTNRNNYAADTGSTNTVALSFSPPVVGGYTTGLEIAFKAAALNSGAVVVNANGLGNRNLVNSDGSAMQAGQIQAGSVYKAAYDGTAFIFISGGPAPATKAQMQTATSAVTFVTPAQAQNHPGAAKAWTLFIGTNTGTISSLASYNVSSVTRLGGGTYSVVFTTAFASTAFVAVVQAGVNSSVIASLTISKTATSCVFATFSNSGSPIDSGDTNFVAYGTQ